MSLNHTLSRFIIHFWTRLLKGKSKWFNLTDLHDGCCCPLHKGINIIHWNIFSICFSGPLQVDVKQLAFDIPLLCLKTFFTFLPSDWVLSWFCYLSDVDECSLGQSHCSSFATCYNTPGSYKCKCKDGYRGMGQDCKRKSWEQNPGPDVHFCKVEWGLTSLFSLLVFLSKKCRETRGEGGKTSHTQSWN